MIRKLMTVAAMEVAFTAVPAAAQSETALSEKQEYLAAVKHTAPGLTESTTIVARKMLEMVAQRENEKEMLARAAEEKKRLSLNDRHECADCKEEHDGCADSAKCDSATKCKKAKCQSKA